MSDFSLMAYAPIGIMFLVAIGFAVSQLLVTQLIGPRKGLLEFFGSCQALSTEQGVHRLVIFPNHSPS